MPSRREALILAAAACAAGFGGATADPRQFAARELMQAKAREPGVRRARQGLLYRVLREGPAGGPHPRRGDQVQVRYEVRLSDGALVDATGPKEVYPVKVGAVIEAWNLALPMMRPGDLWELYAPPELAYGAEGGGGGKVPPYAVLVFKLELVSAPPKA